MDTELNKFAYMTRVHTKIGDIFSVTVDCEYIKYFQLIAVDRLMLNSAVIRAFTQKYPIDHDPVLSEIVNGEVEFYAHCFVKLGVKMNCWKKVGNFADVGPLKQILFRDTNDYGSKIGEQPINISYNWYVWRINDEDYTRVGKLEGENRKAEIGVVVNPYDVVDRMKTGKYEFVYPGYE